MGNRTIDLVGARFGRLVVRGDSGVRKHGWVVWLCLCDCGKESLVPAPYLKSGGTRSCGCFKEEVIRSGAHRSHGMSESPTWHSWKAAMGRCENPNNPRFSDYGGRGIMFCERWKSFENFLEDMGIRPDGMSLDRKDNSKGYEPGNCRWATRREQALNCRSNVLITLNGVTKTQSEWSSEYGVDQRKVSNRIRHLGWSAERALTTP